MVKIYQFNDWVEKQMGKTTVLNVAEMFLSIESMTHKKLQKLCYYAYSWYYTLYGERLFKNRFEAWIHGPVDITLYQEFKSYGWQEIPMVEDTSNFDEEIYEFVEHVFQSYGDMNGDELEYLTHSEEPWIEARGGIPEFEACNNPIQDEVIRKYFLQVLEVGQND